MSNTIRLLESLGGHASPSGISPEQLEQMIRSFGVDGAERDALLAADQEALNDLMGGRAKMMCLIFEPGEERKEGEEPLDQPLDEPAPEQEEE